MYTAFALKNLFSASASQPLLVLGLAWLVAAAGEGAGAGQELPGAGHQHGPRHQAGAHHAPQPGHLLTHHTTTDNMEWWRSGAPGR